MLRQALVGSLNKNDGGPPLPPEAEGIPDLPEPVASTGKSFPAEAVPLPQGEDEWDEDEEKSEPKKRVPPGPRLFGNFIPGGDPKKASKTVFGGDEDSFDDDEPKPKPDRKKSTGQPPKKSPGWRCTASSWRRGSSS